MDSPNLKDLMNAFHFSEADLEANRMGQLTDNQRKNLSYISYILSKLDNASINLLIRIFLFLFVLVVVPSFTPINDLCRAVYVVSALIAGAFFLGFIKTNKRFSLPRRTHKMVMSAEGIIKLQTIGNQHILKLNRRRFLLTSDQHNVLTSGTTYRLYYLGQVLLSIEPIKVDNGSLSN
jgi:hypothetical protein